MPLAVSKLPSKLLWRKKNVMEKLEEGAVV